MITRRTLLVGTGASLLAGCDSLTDSPALMSAEEAHRFLQRTHGLLAADEQGNRLVREDHDVPQRQDGEDLNLGHDASNSWPARLDRTWPAGSCSLRRCA